MTSDRFRKMYDWDTFKVKVMAADIANIADNWGLDITVGDAVDLAFDLLARADVEVND